MACGHLRRFKYRRPQESFDKQYASVFTILVGHRVCFRVFLRCMKVTSGQRCETARCLQGNSAGCLPATFLPVLLLLGLCDTHVTLVVHWLLNLMQGLHRRRRHCAARLPVRALHASCCWRLWQGDARKAILVEPMYLAPVCSCLTLRGSFGVGLVHDLSTAERIHSECVGRSLKSICRNLCKVYVAWV